MFDRFFKIIMGLSILGTIVSPIGGLLCWVADPHIECIFNGVFLGFFIFIISVGIQYIIYGNHHPLYMFKRSQI